jgi:hypothetical protein
MSAQPPTARPATTAVVATAATAPAAPVVLPSEKALAHAARFCIQQDKPLMFDYYLDSRSDKAFVGENVHTKERNLVKSADEYTSPIRDMYKIGDDCIMITENSVYIVSGSIKKKATE